MNKARQILPVFGILTFTTIANSQTAKPATVSFQRDIRPILSNICSACHGPDEKVRKANLRLDTREGVLRTLIAGKPHLSNIYLRMKATGPTQMPPASFLKRPTLQQIELVGQLAKAAST